MEWSKYQHVIFEAVHDQRGGDLVVQARAGAAKTSTLVESLLYTKESEHILVVAFNRGIWRELRNKAPSGVEVLTLHSYGFHTVMQALGKREVDDHRTSKLVFKLYGSGLPIGYSPALCKAIENCKNRLAETPEEIDSACGSLDAGIDPPYEIMQMPIHEKLAWRDAERPKFVARVRELLEESARVGANDAIDYGDMIWLPHALRLQPKQFDRIFTDESQDLNLAQVRLVEKGLLAGGRVCVVGDDRQAIYGWRGADPRLLDWPGAMQLRLPICYRCAASIIKVAQRIVPDIEVWDQARDGVVHQAFDPGLVVSTAERGDFILSRTNAPLVQVWLSCLRAGKPARILGRDIGSAIARLVKRAKVKTPGRHGSRPAETVAELLTWISGWAEIELSRAKEEDEAAQIRDTQACIHVLCDGLLSVSDVLNRIETMFTQEGRDVRGRITLSTVHKAKGLQCERAFLLMNTFCSRSSQEEKNIFYVAVTRAKHELFLAGDSEDWRRCTLDQPRAGTAHG